MHFCVLGRVAVEDHDGRAIGLGGPQQRRLLGALLAAAGHCLTTDELVEALWPHEGADAGHATSLRSYVFRLRGSIGDAAVVTTDSGYGLVLHDHDIDAHRFDAAVQTAFEGRDARERVAVLDEALHLWSGRPYGEFADEVWCRGEVARLEELHLIAVERHAAARMEIGRAAEAIPDLESQVREHPLREHLVALLVRALDSTGRRADALRRLHAFRTWLRNETGLDPGRELVELERELLAGDTRAAGEGPVRGYVLGEVIGEGSFGTVFQATQTAIGREVAVKVIRAELADDPAFIRRFEAEAQLVASLEHPHIVPVYDYWREPGGAYLVFRLLRGGSAADQLVTRGPLRVDEVSSIVEHVGGALAVAHAAGVVHRDVKPANVLFDEHGQAFLADFGIAVNAAGPADVSVGTDLPSAGSPTYAAPEQMQAAGATARSDQYAFGIVLYELLTGVVPFRSDSPAGMLESKLAGPVPSCHAIQGDVPASCDAVLRKATAPRLGDRFADVSEMILAWRVAVASSPIRTTGAEIESPRTAAARTVLALALERHNPYKGLRAFSEADATDFFGREELASQLAAALAGSRFVAVVGPSGSGKSSVVRAGLLPGLRAAGAYVATMTPGVHPFDELETALLRIAVNPPASLKAQLAEERGLTRAVKRILPDGDRAELVLVVDQFEELYILTTDVTERDRFLAVLVELIGDANAHVRVVVTLRADFYDRPLEHPGLGSFVRDHTFALTPLSTEELHAAISRPAARVGVTIEPLLLTQVAADVAAQSGSLPLLQYALTELYDHRVDGAMTLAAYRELGGVAGALTARAENVYANLDATAQGALPHLFARLVSLGEGVADTRRRALWSELSAVPAGVVDMFGQHRLLAFDRDPVTRQPTVEVAHEALIVAWPRLRTWLNEDRDALRTLRQVSDASQGWDLGGRDPDDLLRGARLASALELVTAPRAGLADVEREFVTASATAEEAAALRQRRTARRLRTLLAATAAGLVLALVAGGLAAAQRSRADRNARLASTRAADAATQADQARAESARAKALGEAVVVRSLVTESAAAQARDLPLSLLLAREANSRSDDASTRGALFSALVSNDPVVGFWWIEAGYSYMALSEDGSVLVGGRDDGQVEVRRTADGTRIGTPFAVSTPSQNGQGFATVHLAVAAGGTRLLVASHDGSVSLWDLEARRSVRAIRAGTADGSDGAFFADVARGRAGTVLATSLDGTVGSYDASTGAALGVVATVLGRPGGLAVDATGETFAVGYAANGTLGYAAFSLSTGATVAQHALELAGGSVDAWAISPDGTSLAASSTTGGAQIFDLHTGARRGPLNRTVIDARVAFVSNERLVAVSAVAIVFDVATGEQIAGPYPASPAAAPVVVDLGRERVYTADQFAGTVVRLDFEGDRKIGHDLGLAGLIAEGDRTGRRVAVGTPDGGGIVIDAATGRPITPPLRTPATRPTPFRAVPQLPTFSPDGTEIAIGGLAGTVDIYDAATGGLRRSLAVPPDTPQQQLGAIFGDDATRVTGNASWSPDGSLIAVGFWTTVTVLDAHTGHVEAQLKGFSQIITGAAFSPDSHRVLASSYNGTTRLFDAHTGAVITDNIGCGDGGASQSSWTPGRPPAVGRSGVGTTGGTVCVLDEDGHLTATRIQTAAWAIPEVIPDEQLYVGLTLSPLETVVQDLTTGTVLGHMSGLGLVTLDGKALITASEGLGEVVEWTLDPAAWKQRACEVAGRNLTRAEWQRYLPNEDYRATCPQYRAA